MIIEYDDALSFLLKRKLGVPEVEQVLVVDSLDRVLAENLFAPFDVPPFNNSQVDGFALGSCVFRVLMLFRDKVMSYL